MTTVDYLVIGCGLTGSTIARLLHDRQRDVLILDRRPHRGGNVHDTVNSDGIRIHTYGPHYFRCSSDRLWNYVRRFSEFYPYEAVVQCQIEDRFESWPVNRRHFEPWAGWEEKRPTQQPGNFEEACLQKMPRPIYEQLIRGYTRRQWGIDPDRLEPALANRVRINLPHELVLTPQHRYQGLPKEGYASFMENMVRGIPCRLGVDYLQCRDEFTARKAVIFTGPIDEFFGFDLGRLKYRGQRRVHQTFSEPGPFQPCAQVNYPNADDQKPIRTIEWKQLLPSDQRAHVRGSVVTGEFPFSPTNPDQFEYPFPDDDNRKLYERYRRRAKGIPNLFICGRLGEYRYFDMDQAIGRAMLIARRLP